MARTSGRHHPQKPTSPATVSPGRRNHQAEIGPSPNGINLGFHAVPTVPYAGPHGFAAVPNGATVSRSDPVEDCT